MAMLLLRLYDSGPRGNISLKSVRHSRNNHALGYHETG